MPENTLHFPTPPNQWVGIKEIRADSWLPAFYSQEYLKLDELFRDRPNDFVTLGDLVRVGSAESSEESQDYAWLVALGDQRITAAAVGATREPHPLLPSEAILVPRLLRSVDQEIPIQYWHDDGGPGKAAATSRHVIVLRSLTPAPVGWIAGELSQPYCQQQILRRCTSTTSLPQLFASDLLTIRVRLLGPEEQLRANEAALGQLRLQKNQSSSGGSHSPTRESSGPVLTGSTFEERRIQFEDYIRRGNEAEPLAFVEAATTNRNSDLFAVRLLTIPESPDRIEVDFAETVDFAREKWWRGWYWNGSKSAFAVLNSILVEPTIVLPAHILGRLIPALLHSTGRGPGGSSPFKSWRRNKDGRTLLPTPAQLRELMGVMESPETFSADQNEEGSPLSSFLETDQDGAESRSHALQVASAILRQIFRPILAVRIVREGRTAGVYMLAVREISDDPVFDLTRLQGLGDHLVQIFQAPDAHEWEAARLESLRRLSWFSHQINGPVGRAAAALQDVQECLAANRQAASLLVPNEATAYRMAAMAGQPIERYQLEARLEAVAQAISDLRRVNYQIRQLRRVKGDLKREPVDVLPLIKEQLQRSGESLPNLRVRAIHLTPCRVDADAQLLREAFQEVFNNAIRELKARKSQEPEIEVIVSEANGQAQISIKDNGLPALIPLIDRPFEEDSSTYSQQGQGSGLGLTVVREIILRHAGNCTLAPNCDADGERVDGVTFTCTIPIMPDGQPNHSHE